MFPPLLVLTFTYKHLSSTTLITDRNPFCDNFGVGALASDPSPKNRGPSSHFVICAASRIVKGLTRTVTEIEFAAPLPASISMDSCRHYDDEHCIYRELSVGRAESEVDVVGCCHVICLCLL